MELKLADAVKLYQLSENEQLNLDGNYFEFHLTYKNLTVAKHNDFCSQSVIAIREDIKANELEEFNLKVYVETENQDYVFDFDVSDFNFIETLKLNWFN